MKEVSSAIMGMSQTDISQIERDGKFEITVAGENQSVTLEDVEIISEDIPGWLVANEDRLTVALDVTITEELKQEGIARELINRIQNLRKDAGFDVTDKVKISILKHELIEQAIDNHKEYIASQTLALDILMVDAMPCGSASSVELDTDLFTSIKVEKIG
jgi:isoleucyl-tRNA synthetase